MNLGWLSNKTGQKGSQYQYIIMNVSLSTLASSPKETIPLRRKFKRKKGYQIEIYTNLYVK